MREADTFTERLFTMRHLDDFVTADHPLRVIRVMGNKALANMGELFAQRYAADIKGVRPSTAPEKLLRAMLIQVLYSVRSERQQTQCNLLFRWFIGLAMDDAIWEPTVFSKNRERLIEQQAQEGELLSGEQFSLDGTLIQAWAGHKSFVRKGGGDGKDGDNFNGQARNNDTHQSCTDADAMLYRKGNTASDSFTPMAKSAAASIPRRRACGKRTARFEPTITAGIEPSKRLPSNAKSTLPSNKCPSPARRASGIACAMSVAIKRGGVNRKGYK